MPRAERLRLHNIVKEYPGCRANDGIDLVVEAGEIHALLGENGAGKSTLMKIIYGVIQPDAGEIRWNGEARRIEGPVAARGLGIGMVFQHFSLFETLTVTENIALGLPPGEARDLRALATRIRDVSAHYGIPLDPRRYVNTLSIGEQQRVEIVRCLLQQSSLLILDEPTSVLTPAEVETLFSTLRTLAAEGCSIVFISHKLQEVVDLCHTATVLRQGRVTGACNPAEVSREQIARMMVGDETPLKTQVPKALPGAPLLRTSRLSYTTSDPFGTSLHDIDLELRAGEIIGIAGVAGNGQDELLRTLSGEIASPHDSLRLEGRPIGRFGPARRRRLGMAVVPEERLGRGAVPTMPLTDNTLLTAFGRGLVGYQWVFRRRVRALAERICASFDVRTVGVHSNAAQLSGGNLQKFIIGREALQEPRVLIASHPTWGVDIGSAVAIREALVRLRDNGACVLILSEDLDELFQLSTRMGAISAGRLSPLASTQDLGMDTLGQWMAGEFDTPSTQTTGDTADHAIA